MNSHCNLLGMRRLADLVTFYMIKEEQHKGVLETLDA